MIEQEKDTKVLESVGEDGVEDVEGADVEGLAQVVGEIVEHPAREGAAARSRQRQCHCLFKGQRQEFMKE